MTGFVAGVPDMETELGSKAVLQGRGAAANMLTAGQGAELEGLGSVQQQGLVVRRPGQRLVRCQLLQRTDKGQFCHLQCSSTVGS